MNYYFVPKGKLVCGSRETRPFTNEEHEVVSALTEQQFASILTQRSFELELED